MNKLTEQQESLFGNKLLTMPWLTELAGRAAERSGPSQGSNE
jgi:hypothetical protein